MPAEHAIVSEIGEIIEAIRADELVLPSMPEVSLRVREAAEHDDVSVASICDVIASDAAIAARIIKVANSPLFRAAKEVDNLKAAISRMGIPYTCNLAIGVTLSVDVGRHGPPSQGIVDAFDRGRFTVLYPLSAFFPFEA